MTCQASFAFPRTALMRGLHVLLASVITTSLAAAADVRLAAGPYLRVGSYAAVEVRGAGPGRHVLRGEQVLSVSWEGPAPVILPVLVVGPVVQELRLEVDGRPVALPVEPLVAGERLLLDASGTLDAQEAAGLGQVLFPREVVRSAQVSPAGAAVAYEAADAILIDRPPSPAQMHAWLAAGVSVVVLREPQDDAWQPLEDAAAWVRRPVDAAVPAPVEPGIYAASLAWRPGRPAVERWGVVASLCALVLATAGVVTILRHGRRQAICLLILSGASVIAMALWMQLRPDVAVRQATFHLRQQGREPLQERWLFLAAPEATEPVEARIAFIGATRPIAYDATHLRELSPMLLCDPDGTPREWRLRLPPHFTAAAVQRSAARDEPPPRPEAWAQPLVDNWYRGQG